jgi:hypothetical protein
MNSPLDHRTGAPQTNEQIASAVEYLKQVAVVDDDRGNECLQTPWSRELYVPENARLVLLWMLERAGPMTMEQFLGSDTVCRQPPSRPGMGIDEGPTSLISDTGQRFNPTRQQEAGMNRRAILERLKREQEVFCQLKPRLLESHRGKYAVVMDGELRGIYESRAVAYGVARLELGPDAVFLVAEITDSPLLISMSWIYTQLNDDT